MSHFCVMVIGDDVDGQLAPYHEFECTGEDDRYVQNIDETAKVRAEYETATTTRLRAPDGSLHKPYDNAFYRDPTPEEVAYIGPIAGTGGGQGLRWASRDWLDGRGYRTKVHFVPEGYEEVTVARSAIETLAEFVEGYHGKRLVPHGSEPDLSGPHKYGWARLSPEGEIVEVVDRTNPNAKWDWWQEGGRYANWLKLKRGGYADSARKGDIAFDGMRDEAGMKAGAKWDKVHALIAGRPVLAWEAVREAHPGDIDAARAAYRAQSVVQELYRSTDDDLRWIDLGEGLGALLVPREQYVQAACDAACATFAVVKDGQWYERGEMGWWACVTNEKDRDTWNREVGALIDGLADDTLLTIVDCHI